jgi:hypothetical protein
MVEPCPRQRLKCLHHSCLPCYDCTTAHDRKRVGFCFCVPHTFIVVHATVTSGRHRKLNNRICFHHGNLSRCSKVVDLSGWTTISGSWLQRVVDVVGKRISIIYLDGGLYWLTEI